MSADATAAAPAAEEPGSAASAHVEQRSARGDLGSLPVISGSSLIIVFFQIKTDNFLTAGNFKQPDRADGRHDA